MVSLFETILYQPIFNIFVALYNVVPDVGLVIVVITVVIKLLLYPLTKKQVEAQNSLKELQPKLQKIKKEYDDQQKVAEKTMELYKENKVNPFGSCLPMLIQLPLFLALFWVLRDGLGTTDFHLLYSFVQAPEQINPMSLGLVDLSQSGTINIFNSIENLVLASLAAGAQYWQTKSMKTDKAPQEAGEGADDENMMASMNKMMHFMPIIIFFISYTFPGGLALYFFLSNLGTALQYHTLSNNGNDDDSEDSDKTKKDEDQNDNSEESEVIEGEIVD